MKKNFLLLLWLVLLPLASWAGEPISSVKLSVANVPYGTEALVPQTDFLASWDANLVYGTDVIWNGKVYSEDGTEVEDLATAPVGKYYVTFEGGHFYEGTVNVNFQILKKKLYVSVKGDIVEGTAENLFTTFGVPFDVDDIEGVEDVEGLVNGEDFDDVVEGEITAITTEETDANADDEGHPFAIVGEGEQMGSDQVPGYTATLVGLTSQNYEIVCVNPMYIKQKNISDGEGLTFALPVNFATYNGQVQEPAYNITYGNAVLVQGDEGDFTVSYPQYATTTNFNGPLAVGGYETVIVGQGNFTGTYPAEDSDEYGVDPFLWTIKKAGLTIITLDQTKVYDGTKTFSKAEGDAYEVLLPYGIEGPDADNIGTVNIADIASANVGSYTVTATVSGQNPNYDYNIQNIGKNTITKRGLTIAVDKTGKYKKLYTEADPNPFSLEHVTFTGTLVEGEESWTVPAADITAIKNPNKNPQWGGGLKITRTDASDNSVKVHEDVLVLSIANYNNDKVKNYDITFVPGDFTISGGKIYITALSQSKNYGDEDPDWTAVAYNSTTKTGNYRVDGLVGNDQLITEPTLAREEGEAVGNYVISASGAVAPSGYEDIVYANGKFTINPRPITITLASQTMKDGDRTSTLDQNAYTLEGTLAPGDVASDLFNLKLVPFESAAEGSPYVPGVPEVEAQDAVWSFESFSTDDPDDEDGWQYGVGEVEVGETIESGDEDYTEVTVTKNEPRGATTWNQAQAFVNQKFYVNLDAADYVGLEEGEKLDGRYELYTATEEMEEQENPAYAEAVAANPDTDVPQWIMVGTGNYLMNGTDIWVEITLAKAAVEHQDAIPEQAEVEPGEESGVYVTEPNTKKEAVALRPDVDGVYAEYIPGIYLNILDAEKWANYEVTNGGEVDYTYGESDDEVTVPAATLYVIPADALILDDQDAELAEKIEAADDGDAETATFVAFGKRTLKAGQWNTLVLPFDTDVEQLSGAFGYAVVDMLNEANTNASLISLELAFGDIPANTPFLIQPKEDVELSDGYFFTKDIIYSDDPMAVDEVGHQFKGTYVGHTVAYNDATEYYYSSSAKKFAHAGNPNGIKVGKMRAYLKDETGTAARILVQEPNGEVTTTAIREVNAETEAAAAEGWFTVNGMKMEGAPAQKGIYINNGKKVLVK